MRSQAKRATAAKIIFDFIGQSTGLTPRQYDVATFALLGLNAKQIAEELRISRDTVRVHLLAIYRYFDVAGQPEFMALLLLPHVFGET